MKVIVFTAVLFSALIAHAGNPINVPHGTMYVRPNLYKGYTFYGHGGFVGRAIPNNAGNYNYYDRHGFMYSRGRQTVGGQYMFRYYHRR